MDRRATHFWDGDRKLGRFIARTLGSTDGTTAWDVFLVYGPDAKWGERPMASGAPVVSESRALERALAPYVRDS